MPDGSNTRPKTEEVAALGARIDRVEERLAAVRRQVAQRERQEERLRDRSADPDGTTTVRNRTTVHRDGLTVIVEDVDGGTPLEDILRACKDAILALSFPEDCVQVRDRQEVVSFPFGLTAPLVRSSGPER